MFKQAFFLGLVSGIMATVACVTYSHFYKPLADFSEVTGIFNVSSKCLMFTMASCFLYVGFRKMVRNLGIAEFIFNVIISMVSIATVFYVLKIDDPVFKNPAANEMSFLFKGFVMPMLFFPALAWYTFKPLFIKK